MLKAIPFVFPYESRWLNTTNVINFINNQYSINSDDVIWKIRWYYIDESNPWIPSRIYLWISANIKNERNSVRISNENLNIDWFIDNQHTVLQDFVIVLSFMPNWNLVNNWSWNNSWLALVFFEWYSRIAMITLNHISEIFNSFIGSFMAFQESRKYLETIINFIDEIKTDYIAPYNNWTRTKVVIYWNYTLKPKFVNYDMTIVRSFLDNADGFIWNIQNITKELYVNAFWKKIRLTEEDWRLIAMAFPQNINLKDYTYWKQVKRFFQNELSTYNSWSDDDSLLWNNINIYNNMTSLKDYLWILIDEYQNTLTNNR